MSEQNTHSGIIRCLVVQLGRGSDVLETLLALRATQQLYPRMEITLVCRENFADLAREADWLREVVALPLLEKSENIKEMMGPAARWISPLIQSESWDMIVNWSYSEASSYLTALLPAKLKLGYTRRKDLDFSSGDAWSQFIHGAVQESLDPGIHFTDMITTQLLTALQVQFGEPADAGNQSVTGRDFFNRLPISGDPILDPSRIWIGLQIDSNYKSSEWSRLIKLVLERHPEVQIVLLGDKHQRELTREVSQTCHHQGMDPRRIVSLVGETDAELWIDVLGQCRWVITCSPLPAHLASLLGTRVLQISNLKDPSWIQAAYGNQHLLISTTDEKVPVAPEAVYAAWSFGQYEKIHPEFWSFSKHLDRLGFSSLTEWTELKRSSIRPSDEGGGVSYDSEFERPMTTHEWVSLVHAQIARQWYCGWNPPVGSELRRSRINGPLMQDLRALDESSGVLARVLGEAARTAEQFHTKSTKLKSEKLMSLSDKQELETLGRRLLELQKLVERLAAADQNLALFSSMLKVMMHNLAGDQISEISKETLLSYRQLEQGALLMRNWIQHTLRLSRPAVVAPLAFQPIP